MDTLRTTAHVSSNPFTCSTLPASKPKQFPSVRCGLPTTNWRESRRLVSISLVVSHLLLIPRPRRTVLSVAPYSQFEANAGSILDKYVKRKMLEPLEAYVPVVILTQFQIKDLGQSLEGDQPQYAFCRSLLRSGPAASLRVNIRAVAQYASESGNGKTASDDVDQCLRALEELDSLLLHASRNDPEASVKLMKAQINVALDSLDGLLKTVPSNVLDKGKVIADAYRNSAEEADNEISDPELKQLESIL